ncbi:hypothetical protein BJ741DRAFT_663499 [Chytriomyces cf. hyalinus JEL632]|nr:hypothetical protein BJ741DRAFT_663499 [Chytriomyces cf. hyalinus JEL632]
MSSLHLHAEQPASPVDKTANQSSRRSTASSNFSTTRKKTISEVERLEIENRKMEDRLIALKENLSKQKEKRGQTESIWKGGDQQRGSLKTYADDVLIAKRMAKKKQTTTPPSNLKASSIYAGIADEANAQLQSFEGQMETRLQQLDSLHSQYKGDSGLTESAASKTKSFEKTDPVVAATDASVSSNTHIQRQQEHQTEPIQPTPPTQPISLHMWQIPSHPTTPHPTTLEDPQPPPPKSFLSALETWTSAATASAAEIPSSKSLPQGTTPFRIRRSRLRLKSPPPVSSSSSEPIVQQPASISNNAEFNEQESHNSFIEALNEWRKGAPEKPEPVKAGLVNGQFDEQKSRDSFLEALKEWRSGTDAPSPTTKTHAPKEDDTVGTSTTASFDNNLTMSQRVASALESIAQSSSLSYLDKLLLARLRQNDATTFEKRMSPTKSTYDIEDSDSEDFSASVFWPASHEMQQTQVQNKPSGQERPEIELEFEVLSNTSESGSMTQCLIEEPEDDDIA